MSSRTKLAIIISSVLAVVVSLVICLVVVKGTPDLDDIRDRLENQSQIEVTKTTRIPKTTETEASTDAVTMAEVSVMSTTNTTFVHPYTTSIAPIARPTTTSGAVSLSSIAISSLPSKTTYYIGDSFSASGMSVTARYSNGTTRSVSGTIESYPDMYSSGYKEVSVYYTDSYGNKKYDYFTITVKSPYVSLPSTSTIYLDVGDYEYISSYSDPNYLTVTWKSSDPSVASVNSSGKITALKSGSTYISASITYNGRVYTSSSCKVYVTEPETQPPTNAPSTITISKPTWSDCNYYSYDGVLYFTNMTGYISSNYYLDYVCVGMEGPAYINGNYDTIDQYYTFDRDEINSKHFSLDEYITYLDFDYIPNEEYCFYIYAEDSSGNSEYYESYITIS